MMSIHSVKKASSIILHGGLVRISSPTLKFRAVNIALTGSNAWLNGLLIIDKKPYYRLGPQQDHNIEIKNIRNNYFLAVNERVIYQRPDIFGYTLNINLNTAVADRPYADLFKYY